MYKMRSLLVWQEKTQNLPEMQDEILEQKKESIDASMISG